MGKLYLTEAELEQFPTISDLVSKIGNSSIKEWGFCQNENGDIALGENTDTWQLVIPFIDIHVEAQTYFGLNYSPSNLKVIYDVEVYPDPNFVCFELVDMSEYQEYREELSKYPPIILSPTTN